MSSSRQLDADHGLTAIGARPGPTDTVDWLSWLVASLRNGGCSTRVWRASPAGARVAQLAGPVAPRHSSGTACFQSSPFNASGRPPRWLHRQGRLCLARQVISFLFRLPATAAAPALTPHPLFLAASAQQGTRLDTSHCRVSLASQWVP